MSEECPLCKISKNEFLLYSDNDIYLCSTKENKGHKTRVMCVVKRHTIRPSFSIRMKAYYLLITYMQQTMKDKNWFIVSNRYASIKNHWHIIACDEKGTPEELQQLHKTPKTLFPIKQEGDINLSPLKKKILVCIPAYNECATIGWVIKRAKEYGEVVVIDDGSQDLTSDVALNHGAGVTENDKNYGYGYCIGKAFRMAREGNYDILITLDADDQHNPHEIPTFLKALENDIDVVIGNRFMKKEHSNNISILPASGYGPIPGYRGFVVKVISKIEGFGDAQCGFRAYSRKAINILSPKEKGMGVSLEILYQAKENNLKIAEVPCTVKYNNKTKHSQHPLLHGSSLVESILWSRIWKKPLTYIGFPGLLILLIGILSSFQLLLIYSQIKIFVFSWTILSLGGLFLGTLLFLTSTILYLLKRALEETK